MRRHTSREDHKRVSTSTLDRRDADRNSISDLYTTQYVVVLGMGNIQRGELLDKSDRGVGIRVAKISDSTDVGEVIELLHLGNRNPAVIRHITETAEGYVIGLQWQTDCG